VADIRIVYLIPGPLSAGRGEAELERRRSILQSWASPGVEVGIAESTGGPPSIESAYDEYLSIPDAMETALRVQDEGWDAMILGCFGDPGLDGFRELLDVPIVGPCEASMHVAATLGHEFGIVTVLDSVVMMLRKLARAAALDARLASVVSCDIPVLELGNESYDALLGGGRRALEEGADTLILGCMSMAFLGVAERLAEDLGVPVVNPARTSLKMAELLAGSGLTHSRLAFPVPPKLVRA
jgi:allantoin racemase